jgi:hypothetical protein
MENLIQVSTRNGNTILPQLLMPIRRHDTSLFFRAKFSHPPVRDNVAFLPKKIDRETKYLVD